MNPHRSTNGLRICAILGIGLIAISFAMANLRPYAGGDMRIFTWAMVAAIALGIGGILLLAAVIGGLVTAVRRRSNRQPS